MNLRKTNNSTSKNSQLTRFFNLAISLSIVSSTCLPTLAVLSAPPSTSKSKTEKTEKDTANKDSKKDSSSSDESAKTESNKDTAASNESAKTESKNETTASDESAKTESKNDTAASDESAKTESKNETTASDESAKTESKNETAASDESAKAETNKDTAASDESTKTESKNETTASDKSANTESKKDTATSDESAKTESIKETTASDESANTESKNNDKATPKLELVAPVLDKPDSPADIVKEVLKKSKGKDPVQKNSKNTNKSADESKTDSSSDFGYDKTSTGATSNSDEPKQALEVEQSIETTKNDKAEQSEQASEVSQENTSEDSTESVSEAEPDSETAEEPAEQVVTKPKHIAEADNYLLKNKFEKAEKAYRLLLEEDENGDAYAGLAVSLAKQENAKKVVEAEEILKKGKEDFPDNPNMMAAAGFVAFKHSKNVASPAKRDRYVEASEQLCGMAISANPDIVIAQQTLGMVKLFQDEPREAIPPFKVCYEITEDETNATLLAKALLRVNPKDRQAKSLVDEALEINPEYSPAVLQKAIYLTNTGKHEEAFTELHSIPRPERESEWYQVQGDIYKKQGDGNSSVNSWKESMRRNPRSPDPYKRLAEHYTMRGDGELAIAEMHSALEILPNDINMRQKLAELALRMDKLEVAEQEFRTILSVRPNDPSAVLGLARVFFRKARREGQYPQGWIELKSKLQDVISERSLVVRGGKYQKEAKEFKEKIQLTEAEKALTQKQFRDARRLFGEIINKHQDEPFQLLTLAEQAYNDGDLRSAELAYSYAREIPEVAPRAEQGISKITSQRKEAKRQIKLGDATERKLPDVAEDHYKQALIADPQDANAFYNLFILYVKERKDKIEKAIEYANGFLEASQDTDERRQQVEKILFKLKDRLRKQNSK